MPSRTPRPDESVHWPVCPDCKHKHQPGSDCPQARSWGVIWLKRPMPPDQWPPDERAPRDNTFRWWIRSHCGHAAKQWAFYTEQDADLYEVIFKDNPCFWTRCHDQKRRA